MLNCDIGFIGLAGSGKDTAAMALTARGWRRMAFADRLKSLAFSFGWDGHKDDKGRKLLQDLGMAARAYNPEFWINEANMTLNCSGDVFAQIPRVWTDVRFENEADFVRKRGGIIVRVRRPVAKQDASDHVSETTQRSIRHDYEIVNDGTVEELHDKVLKLINL